MDLSFGPEYETFRAEVRSFLKDHGAAAPRGSSLRAPETLAWQKLLIEHGYAARTIPKAYGGYGAEPNIIQSRIIAEEFADARVSTGLGGQGISMLVPTLLEIGTEAQKQEFIRPTNSGRNGLVSGLLGARRRFGPGQPENQRGPGRRRVGDQRPENLDQHRPAGRLDLLSGTHGTRMRPNTKVSPSCCSAWTHQASRCVRWWI